MISAHNGEKNIPDCVQMFPSGKFAVDFMLLSSYILFITLLDVQTQLPFSRILSVLSAKPREQRTVKLLYLR